MQRPCGVTGAWAMDRGQAALQVLGTIKNKVTIGLDERLTAAGTRVDLAALAPSCSNSGILDLWLLRSCCDSA